MAERHDKKLNLRRVEPTLTKPNEPQSTWPHSPGAKLSFRKGFVFLGRIFRT
jgi:hypothetical protein